MAKPFIGKGEDKALLFGLLVILVLTIVATINIPRAYGAGVTFSASTTVSLTNPAETWTIAGGSNASSVQVGTGNAVVAMQNTDAITLSVNSRNFSITGQSSDAVITRNTLCYVNTGDQQAILTLTATQNETITVTTGACGQYASGGGGQSQTLPTYTDTPGTSTPPPAPAPTPSSTTSTSTSPTSTQTNAELQAQIVLLLAQLAALQAQLGISATANCNFTRSLTLGSQGEDVRCLQQYLNGAGFRVAASGAGAPGSETTYFGARTKAAVAAWQAANGVYPASGYFGPISRAKYNALIGQ